ncbi:MAG: CDP-glucose 4,6-dehydratase [Desulfovibrio sp.]|nr:CDP-glucose 4,6-dehydratase [Desulfovibrio sp.]
MFENRYKGRRVFVTGHTGFKGFWLTVWLLELGAEVTGWSLDVPSTPSGFLSLGLDKRITHLQGDIRDRKALSRALASCRPDAVFHLAAQALVRRSYEDPIATFESNAAGTMNMLEAVRNTPSVKALVLITSDKCYRNDEWVYGYRETDHLGGDDPYSASKACAEIIAHSFFRSFFRPPANGPCAATARAGNVIGGGDWATDRIVPDCARAFARGAAATLRNPGATRPWQHVLEPLSGYLHLGARLLREKTEGPDVRLGSLHGESFNFGPPADVDASVGKLAEALRQFWPAFSYIAEPQTHEEKKESTLLKLCCDKALARLGWKATLSFAETVRFTAEWYREFYRHAPNGGTISSLTGACRGCCTDDPDRGVSSCGDAIGVPTPPQNPPDNSGQKPNASFTDAMYALTVEQISRYCSSAEERGLSWTL